MDIKEELQWYKDELVKVINRLSEVETVFDDIINEFFSVYHNHGEGFIPAYGLDVLKNGMKIMGYDNNIINTLISGNKLSPIELRNCILLVHGMATGKYIQSDTEMRFRIGNVLEKVVLSDDIMREILGR